MTHDDQYSNLQLSLLPIEEDTANHQEVTLEELKELYAETYENEQKLQAIIEQYAGKSTQVEEVTLEQPDQNEFDTYLAIGLCITFVGFYSFLGFFLR